MGAQFFLTGLIALSATAAQAVAPDVSLRPPAVIAGPETVSRAVVTPIDIEAPARSLRPVVRPATVIVAPETLAGVSGSDAGLRRWIAGFRPRALAEGVSPEVFDRAMRDARYMDDVIRRDRNQSEFTKTLWDYLGSAVSETRIANGRAALERHGPLLAAIEERYGVAREVVVAVWGLESAYGAVRGSTPVIHAMATLAHDGRRAAFFEGELIAALQILQDGHTTPERMTGSWAGAMGHTQFMPTSFRRLAVDFSGDGRRDIWSDDPTDALASTAHYLSESGWRTGQPWGVEVTLPRGFDYAQADRDITRMPSEWARLGVVGADGQPVRDYGRASVLVPAGHQGAAFLIFDNFAVIERYNTADAYVIGVGHLADRIVGRPAIQASWPDGDRALTFDERTELQRRLTARGFDTRGVDGRIGPLTIDAVRGFQRAEGMVPDGYANPALLQRLR